MNALLSGFEAAYDRNTTHQLSGNGCGHVHPVWGG